MRTATKPNQTQPTKPEAGAHAVAAHRTRFRLANQLRPPRSRGVFVGRGCPTAAANTTAAWLLAHPGGTGVSCVLLTAFWVAQLRFCRLTFLVQASGRVKGRCFFLLQFSDGGWWSRKHGTVLFCGHLLSGFYTMIFL